MTRTFTIGTLVGLLLVLLTGSGGHMSLADEPAQPPNHIIAFTGRVETVESDPDRISVTIQMTNNPYIYQRGDTEWVYTTADTLFYVWEWDEALDTWERLEKTFADFCSLYYTWPEDEELRVSINADVINAQIVANRVEVDKPRY